MPMNWNAVMSENILYMFQQKKSEADLKRIFYFSCCNI